MASMEKLVQKGKSDGCYLLADVWRWAAGRRWSRAAAVLALAWLLVFSPLPWPVTPVQGATITVTTTADEAGTGTACSLREAIIAANTDAAFGGCPAGSGADTIVLQSGATYTLSLDADGGGHATDSGANNDDLDVASPVTIQGNGATIQRDSTLGCNLDGTADNGEFRIFDVAGTGNLTLQNVTVKQGCADGSVFPDDDGGGIFVASGGTLTITSSTISNNQARFGGGIWNDGTVTISNSTISNNQAGSFGGGIDNSDTLTITNSTISGNSSGTGAQDVGGIWNGDTVNASFVTIANNTGSATGAGGIFRFAGTVNIKNSIVGNNTGGPNCAGGVTATGTNLATDASCGAGFTTVPSTGAGGLNLGPLQVNAPGTTATHALLAGSAAVDFAADCGFLTPPGGTATADQRGVTRPQGTLCDVGAYEARLVTLKDDSSARCLEVESDSQTYAFNTASPSGVLFGAARVTTRGTTTLIRNIGGNLLQGTITQTRTGIRSGAATLSVPALRRIFSILDRNLSNTPHGCF